MVSRRSWALPLIFASLFCRLKRACRCAGVSDSVGSLMLAISEPMQLISVQRLLVYVEVEQDTSYWRRDADEMSHEIRSATRQNDVLLGRGEYQIEWIFYKGEMWRRSTDRYYCWRGLGRCLDLATVSSHDSIVEHTLMVKYAGIVCFPRVSPGLYGWDSARINGKSVDAIIHHIHSSVWIVWQWASQGDGSKSATIESQSEHHQWSTSCTTFDLSRSW